MEAPPEGRKRKLDAVLNVNSKRARLADESQEHHADSDEDVDSIFDGEDCAESNSIKSPITPVSGRASPQFPSQRKTIPCTFAGCDKKFNRQAKLEDHLRSHTNERPFKCSEKGCDKDFMRKTHLNRHLTSAHSAQRNFACNHSGCDKAFSTGTRLRRHLTLHEKRQQYQCHKCGQTFRKHATLAKHKATEHEGKKPFVCDRKLGDGSTCAEGFDRLAGLSIHKTRVHGDAKHFCTICTTSATDEAGRVFEANLGFASYSAYQAHNRSIHPPTCDQCKVSFDTSKLLDRHMESLHGVRRVKDVPKHPCPQANCDRIFSKKGNLDVHIRTVHAQQRQFICNDINLESLNHIEGWNGRGACGKDFKAKCQLEEHIRTVHLGLENRVKARRKQRAREERVSPIIGSSTKPDSRTRSTVGLLTGVLYEGNKRRTWPCTVLGCQYAFIKRYDLSVHLRSRHGFDGFEAEQVSWQEVFPEIVRNRDEGIPTQDNSDGGQAAMPASTKTNDGQDDRTEEKRDNEAKLLELGARTGGQFWIEDEPLIHSSDVDDDDDTFEAGDWATYMEEMEELIGSGNGWEDDIVIDPLLQ